MKTDLGELKRRSERAVRMSAEERFFAGAHLFEYACQVTLAGIRTQHPQATDEECLAMLVERVRRSREAELGDTARGFGP